MDRVKQDSAKTPAGTELPEEIHLVFDGPPGPECGRFVEAEDRYGRSINVGDWIQVGELWHLVIKPRWPTIATGKLPLFVEHQIHRLCWDTDDDSGMRAAILAYGASRERAALLRAADVIESNGCEDYYHGCCDEKNVAAIRAMLPKEPEKEGNR